MSETVRAASPVAGESEQVAPQPQRSLNRLKIAFLIKALGAGPGGGAERVLAMISSALAKRGHEVSVLSFDDPEAPDFYAIDAGVQRIRMGPTPAHPGLATSANRLVRIRRALLRLDPDVAIGFMHSSFIPLGLALMGSRIPVIGSERTSFPHYASRPRQRALLRLSVPLFKALTVNGTEVNSGFPPGLRARMTVIPNPVMEAAKLADPARKGAKTLLCVGGLRPEKDHQSLVLAFARIARDFPEWRLRIVGEGPLRNALESQIEQLGMRERIELAGGVSEVEPEYQAASLFVLPSIYEAFPNCIAEALAHGLPVVGFKDCPGTNALVIHEVNGLLASGEDRIRALSETLSSLMASETLRSAYGKAGPSSVRDYSLSHAVDRWEGLLQEHARPK